MVRFCQSVLKILSGNEILTSIKGCNSVKIWRKMTGNNPKLDLVNVMCIQTLVRFCQFFLKILSGNQIFTESRKDGMTEGQGESSIAPLFQSGAIMKLLEWPQHFPHYNSMGAICCYGNQSSDPICLKTYGRQSPTPMLLHVKSDCNQPASLRDIQD